MEELLKTAIKVGIVSCTAMGAYLGYLQWQTFISTFKTYQTTTNSKIKCQADHEAERPIIEEELSTELLDDFRDRTCNHDWSTCLTDLSGHDVFDSPSDFIDPAEAFVDGVVYYRCERCYLENGHQTVRISLVKIGYGNRSVPGRLSLEKFSARLMDQLQLMK